MKTNPNTLARLSAAERARQDQRGNFAPVSTLNPELDAMLAALSMAQVLPPGGGDRARRKRKARIAKESKRRNRK